MVLNSELDRLQKYKPIEAELNKAKKQHPEWPENIFEQLTVVNEEMGEVNKSVLHYKHENGSLDDIKDELIQTAAMCMRMLENLPKVDKRIKVYSSEKCVFNYCPTPELCKTTKSGCINQSKEE